MFRAKHLIYAEFYAMFGTILQIPFGEFWFREIAAAHDRRILEFLRFFREDD